VRLPFGQLEGDDGLRLDMPVGAGVGDQRRGAEGAFLGVDLRIEGDLRTAIGALGDAGFLHLGGIEPVAHGGAEIELPDAAAPGVPGSRVGVGDLVFIAAMVADQLVLAGGEAHVRAALVAGEAMLVLGGCGCGVGVEALGHRCARLVGLLGRSPCPAPLRRDQGEAGRKSLRASDEARAAP
jgi:hypothetical protein